MATVNLELNILLDHVDDWFSTLPLSEPISQFILDEDKVKLASISRTTLSWFKPLSDPPLTNEGINDHSDFTSSDDEKNSILAPEDFQQISHDSIREEPAPRKFTPKKKCKRLQQKVKNKNPKKKQKLKSTEQAGTILDTLVRDLELLIGHEQVHDSDNISNVSDEPEIVFQNVYCNEDEALLDDSIGACCTIRPATGKIEQYDDFDEKKVIFRNYSDHLLDKYPSDLDSNSKIQTPTPLDHDYIPQPRRDVIKPLSSNKLFVETKRRDNILNLDALKRFAKFSDKFRVLSMVDC